MDCIKIKLYIYKQKLFNFKTKYKRLMIITEFFYIIKKIHQEFYMVFLII
jgi:hypothetical protein